MNNFPINDSSLRHHLESWSIRITLLQCTTVKSSGKYENLNGYVKIPNSPKLCHIWIDLFVEILQCDCCFFVFSFGWAPDTPTYISEKVWPLKNKSFAHKSIFMILCELILLYLFAFFVHLGWKRTNRNTITDIFN